MIIQDNARLADSLSYPESEKLRIAAEHHMTVYINGRAAMRLACTPKHLGELVAGRLITEGILENPEDILEIYISDNGKIAKVSVSESAASSIGRAEVARVSTCCTMNYNIAAGTARQDIIIKQEHRDFSWLPKLCEKMLNTETLFDDTHATHSCFLFKADGALVCRDDIGRHNALDKVIGWGLINGIDMSECMLFTTGRMPEDMVIKAVRARIPVLVSKTFPTDRGIETAGEAGLTLITLRNNGEMTIWKGGEKGAAHLLKRKTISAGELAQIKPGTITIADIREPDEVLTGGINGAVNIPFSAFPRGFEDIEKDKPVIVICREGRVSEDAADYLASKGYEAYSLVGGYNEYRALLSSNRPPEPRGNSERRAKDKTFLVFSLDLDKALAAFIMANGAASLGGKVTMFFSFWGLNIIRKPVKPKSFIEKVLGPMLPRGSKRLGLSRMNMLGLGPKLIRRIMNKKGIPSLEELIESAKSHGVRLVACRMSMDIMGIREEDLIDGAELGGAEAFLGASEKSGVSLFI